MLIDDLRTLFDGGEWELTEAWGEARERLIELIAAYDALAPDWNDAPEWAQWYAIESSGRARWHLLEPRDDGDGGWWVRDDRYEYANRALYKLPIGIDWRLCLWERPAA